MPSAIDRYQLQELLVAGGQLVEVLPEAEFAEEHLEGAVNINLKRLTERRYAGSIATGR